MTVSAREERSDGKGVEDCRGTSADGQGIKRHEARLDMKRAAGNTTLLPGCSENRPDEEELS